MTRLEQHRKSLLEEGRSGPLLKVEDLSPDEIALVNGSFLELCRRRKVADISQTYSAYVDTLHSWGVMCPHPQPHRLYDGWRQAEFPISFDESRWFDCTLCSAAVINR